MQNSCYRHPPSAGAGPESAIISIIVFSPNTGTKNARLVATNQISQTAESLKDSYRDFFSNIE